MRTFLLMFDLFIYFEFLESFFLLIIICIPHGMVQVYENHAKSVDMSWVSDFHTFYMVRWKVLNSYATMPEIS